uniref:4-oxalocrotonate tautomerase n=1 Tax=Thermomicrobium roseum TaxID=500 RepID=A0A7C1K358_THERO
MPMLEIIVARAEPLMLEQKRAFAREAVEIFRTVLGTPPGRLRLAFYELRPEDSLGLLEEPDPPPQPTSAG